MVAILVDLGCSIKKSDCSLKVVDQGSNPSL